MKVICLGDSITYGLGVSSRENWVSLLNDKYQAEFVNKGINGDTTEGMLARFYRDVVQEKPELAIIMGGGNDFIVSNSLGAVKASIMSMVHQAFHYNIIPVIGISIKADIKNIRKEWAHIPELDQFNYRMSEYREWIVNFCSTFKVMSLDFYGEFEKSLAKGNRSLLLDGMHPSREGHKIMADIASRHFERDGLFS